jgi:hypothetical protein
VTTNSAQQKGWRSALAQSNDDQGIIEGPMPAKGDGQ